jgi:hypothetical protein
VKEICSSNAAGLNANTIGRTSTRKPSRWGDVVESLALRLGLDIEDCQSTRLSHEVIVINRPWQPLVSDQRIEESVRLGCSHSGRRQGIHHHAARLSISAQDGLYSIP